LPEDVSLNDHTIFQLFNLLNPPGIALAKLLHHLFGQGTVAGSIKRNVSLQVPKQCRRMEVVLTKLSMQFGEEAWNKAFTPIAEGSCHDMGLT